MSWLKKTAAVAAVLCLTGLLRADRYDDLMAKWMGRFDDASMGYATSTDAMRLAWNCITPFYAACYAYEVTKDATLIATMHADLENNIVGGTRTNPNGVDGYLITSADGSFKNTAATWWSDGVEYSGESFRIMLGILHWVYLVKSNTSLQAQYGTDADAYLDKIQNNLMKKWLDNYWIDETNDPYTDFHYPGAGMVVQPTCDREPNPYMRYSMSSANNKLADAGLAFIMMYRITGDAKYRALASKCAMEFKSKLWWSEDGTYYSWAYQNPFWYMDFNNEILGGLPRHGVWVEHRSGYGNIDMTFVTACYRMGIVFNRTDIDRFVKTNTVIMYNGGAGWLKSDGTAPNTAASESAGPFDALAAYDTSNLLVNMQYSSYDAAYTGYNARCGIPYLVYTMKMAAGELHPPDTMDWVGPLEATDLEVIDRGTIKLTFYNEVDPATVADPANFDFSRGIECIAAEMDPADNKKVIVYTTEQAEAVSMKVRVRNVKDTYGNETFAFPYGNQPYLFVSSTVPAAIRPEVTIADPEKYLAVSPNPVRTDAEIRFVSNHGARPAGCTIRNASGSVVRTLDLPAPRWGTNTAAWDRRDMHGRTVPAGMYVISDGSAFRTFLVTD